MPKEQDRPRRTPTLVQRVLRPGRATTIGCTIVARNYLAQADVLARSFKRHHPECPFAILIVDDLEVRERRDDDVEILGLSDIGLDPGDAYRMPVIYDVTELSTAVKPWLLRHFLDQGAGVVMYFDPDIEIFSPLYDLAELAREHSIVLTPHVTEPIPQDKLRLSESDILGSGIYNLGFIGVGPGSERFLEWWAARLRRECVIDPARMRFTDQRWIDFVPGLFRHYITRDPGLNVAYWNLHSRKVVREGESYTVNQRPLRFFHFSGYSPDFPHILSKHQGTEPRVLLSEHPGVRRILKDYRKQLLDAGFGSANKNPYGFETLRNGLKLDQRLRRIYREALNKSEKEGKAEPPSPFAPGGPEEFIEWLNQPMHAGLPAVTRFMLAVHSERADLRDAFPQPLGADAQGYHAWFVRDGHLQERVHPLLVPGASVPIITEEKDPPVSSFAESKVPVVSVAGYFRAELGVGEAARLLILGLEAAGVPCRTISHDETINRQLHPFREQDRHGGPSDINIICVNADQTPLFGQKMGPEFYRDRYTIGVWFWEIEDFPASFQAAFDYVDEIWVATSFIQQALLKVSPKPVFKFHLPLLSPKYNQDTQTVKTGEGADFTFLYSFDFMSVLERKNPIGAITAFKRAFKPGEGPLLLIKTINGDKKVLDLERVKLAAVSRPDIVISDGYLSSSEKEAMMANCDCYLSLHRSEGFGLTMAEAMSLSKPVIATAYSGNLEFMTPENSYLCSYERREIGYGASPYSPNSHWAEPNLDEAAALMRQVYLNPDEARARGLRAAVDIRTLHSPAVAGAWMSDRIAAIRARRARFGKATPMEIFEQRIEALEAMPRVERLISSENEARLFQAEKEIHALSSQIRNQEIEAAAHAKLIRDLRETAAREAEFVQLAQTKSITELREVVVSESNRLEKIANDQANIRAGLEKRLLALEAMAGLVEENVIRAREAAEQLGRIQADLDRWQNQQMPGFSEKLASISTDLEGVKIHLEAAPFMTDPNLLRAETRDGSQSTIGYRGRLKHDGKSADAYISFENIFRGSEEMIRDRQRSYLSLLRGHSPVVDLGCGRGEMLDLLRAEGIPALGVDLDAGMVARARAKGHQVVQEGAMQYLDSQMEGSIGAIFCAQVIEHLSYEDLLGLLAVSEKKLVPGGLLILETVNPHSHRALKTFWVDLTHNKPIFPEVLIALCQEAGYEEAVVSFPHGTGNFERDRLWEGEYAVAARTVMAKEVGLAAEQRSNETPKPGRKRRQTASPAND